MTAGRHFEKTLVTLAGLNKTELKKRIRNFDGSFKLDFTDTYLNKLTDDRLRHILLAALISAKAKKEIHISQS